MEETEAYREIKKKYLEILEFLQEIKKERENCRCGSIYSSKNDTPIGVS